MTTTWRYPSDRLLSKSKYRYAGLGRVARDRRSCLHRFNVPIFHMMTTIHLHPSLLYTR
jgi:hypothetical protein